MFENDIKSNLFTLFHSFRSVESGTHIMFNNALGSTYCKLKRLCQAGNETFCLNPYKLKIARWGCISEPQIKLRLLLL